jgi:hypothetical protein
MKLLKQVLEFNEAYNIPTQPRPRLLSPRHGVSRQISLQAEMDNLNTAFCTKKIEHIALAISSSIYKLASLACELGLQGHLENCIDEVHFTNMSRIRENKIIALRTNSRPSFYDTSQIKLILNDSNRFNSPEKGATAV